MIICQPNSINRDSYKLNIAFNENNLLKLVLPHFAGSLIVILRTIKITQCSYGLFHTPLDKS